MFIIRYLISLVVGAVVKIRHTLFDIGLLKSVSFSTPTIVVGNLKVGGTGKTPMTELLVSELKSRYRVAVLSRGYGRKSKGFLLANKAVSSDDIGDEPMLLYRRHPDIVVAVCEKRAIGIKEINRLHPEVNLIIMDDAFQHRYVDASINILLTEYDRPYSNDYLLPYGRLRDSRAAAKRAHIIIVTKSPQTVVASEKERIVKGLKLRAHQKALFTSMQEGEPYLLFNRGYEESIKGLLKGDRVILVSAIAGAKHLISSLEERYNLISTHIYKDHYNYKQQDIDKLLKVAIENNSYIIMTEKDAAKIASLNIPAEERYRFYVAPITIEFDGGSAAKSEFIDSLTI